MNAMAVGGNSKRLVEEIHQSIPVPDYKIGWIIGKQGSYINQMIKKSGASITISESTSQEFGRVWRYVHIKGGGRAVDRAKKLLHIRLERLEPREANVEDAILSEEDEGAIAANHGVSDDGYVNQNPTDVEY
jgi:predicted PilT family ATPase